MTSSIGHLLSIRDLTVSYRGVTEPAVKGIDLDVGHNETVALVGQSGSGKSTTIHSLLRQLPSGTASTGSVLFNGVETLSLPSRSFRDLLRTSIGFVPQDPVTALNPVRRIGSQIGEVIRRTLDARTDTVPSVQDVLATVGVPHVDRVARLYPHELSGGMLQRVLVGMAVVGKPRLLVADEPTSALDVSVQRRMLDLLDELKARLGLSVLLITHDLSVAKERADKVVVLHRGRVEESGDARDVFARPQSAYTSRLIADVPMFTPDKYAALKADRPCAGHPPAVELRGLRREFGKEDTRVVALDDLSLSVRRGTTHALVGESGSGKTTAARILLGLERADAGEVIVGGDAASSHSKRKLRRHMQIVYQNPFSSLDPRWRVRRIIREPLDRYGVGDSLSRERRVSHLLEQVGLLHQQGSALIGTLSGGQRQRVAIARALAIEPDVVVLDEPTSALDVSVQAQILDLLMSAQAELGVSYLFVSHDVSVVRQIADDITVLRAGRVEESGRAMDVLRAPRSEYTRALVEAVPGWQTPGSVPALDRHPLAGSFVS